MRSITIGLGSTAMLAGVLMRTVAGAQPASPQPIAPTPAIPAPREVLYPGHIALAVDTSNAAQGIFAVHEAIPVAKGDSSIAVCTRRE